MDRLMRPGSFGHSVQTMISAPNRWRLVKSVLCFAIACGILGATIGSAFHALTGARLAAMIGSIPLAIIGALALGWYGFLFGSVNRLRFGGMLGLVLGLLVGGLVGSVCGLFVLTLPWSLVGALVGGILGSSLTARHRPSLKPFLGTVLGICGGILVLAFQRDQDHARVGAISGSLIGVCAGIGALLAMICALNLMPKMPMEWDQLHDEPESFNGDDHGTGPRIDRRRR
jgi:hypothetical protein